MTGLSKVLKCMTLNKAWKTDMHMQGVGKKKHVPAKRRPSSKKVEVYTSVNNAWKLSNAATVVEAL